MKKMVGSLMSLGTKMYSQKKCLQLSYRRFQNSAVMLKSKSSIDYSKYVNKKAAEWLSNLSPELQEMKENVELVVERVKLENPDLSRVKLSPNDMKNLITDTEGGFYRVQRYLLEQKHKKHLKIMKKIQKSRKKQQMANDPVNPRFGDPGWSYYTRIDKVQEVRRYEHIRITSLWSDAVPVVFDMAYELSRKEENHVYQQLMDSCYENRISPEPCHIHVTSYMKNETFLNSEEVGDFPKGMTLHKKGFEEIFPQEKLVCIAPNAPPLKNHYPGDIYVIGSFNKPEMSDMVLMKANQMGLRVGSFPFKQYSVTSEMACDNKRFSLPLNHMYCMVMGINLEHDWGVVIRDHVNAYRHNKYRSLK